MSKRFMVLLLFLFFPTFALADDQETPADTTEISDEENQFLHLELGATLTNQYFFRGLLQENQGVIGQPRAEVKLSLYSNDWLTDVRAVTGTWNSFHSGPTGTQSNADTPAAWYENRFHVGAEIDILNHITLSGGYIIYTSPNDSLETIQELYVKLAVDDYYIWHDLTPDELLERGETVIWHGAQPYGLMAFEAEGQRDNGLNNGVYTEVGIRPAWTLNPGLVFKVTLPIRIGFSVDQYYEVPVSNPGKLPQDDAFGFTDVGLEGELPIPCISGNYGQLSLHLAGHWFYLGQHTAARNNENKHEIIASGGLRFNY